MPKCGSCGKNYDDPSVMELVRNQDNRWVSVCRSCLDQGIDVNTVQTNNIAVDEHAIALADKPSIDVTLLDDPMENVKKLLDSLRNVRQSRERMGRSRSHERRQIDLVVHFSMSRDDTRHEGTVKDFSQGGLKIVTAYQLSKGQIVQFDWNIPLPPAMARTLQSMAEVRRIVKNNEGLYEVGFKFVTKQQADSGANRRKHRRYKCDMLVYYFRKGSNYMSSGKVKDISQGGCQMRLDDKLEQSEIVSVRLLGGGGTRGDLVGKVQVCRVAPKEVYYLTGCAFEQMRMEQAPAPATKT